MNTFTNLVTDAYAALAVVSREVVGFIPAVNRDSTADRLAQGQTLRSPIAPVNTAGRDATPAMSIPPAAYQTIGNKSLTITKSRAFPFSWAAYEVQSLGPNILNIKQQQIAQAIRAAVGEVSTDVYAALRVGASRAYGTAATTPFASDLSASSELAKILKDNGAPEGDRHLILGTTAGAKLRTLLNNPLNANSSLGTDSVRNGVLLDSNGFMIREDAKVAVVTKGTGTSYQTTAAFAIGDTAITVDTGSGTILAGDVITFAGDTNKYVVASALSGGTVTIAEPGLIAAVADNTAITVGNNFTANIGFSRDFATLATRLPETPEEGDLALFRETITDPVSGISFELVVWPGQRMITYEIALNWGVSVMNPRHGAILLG